MQLLVRDPVFQQGQVQPVFAQGAGQGAAVGHLDFQPGLGAAPGKAAGQPGQQGAAHGSGGPHPQQSVLIPAFQLVLHPVNAFQQVQRLGVEPAGGLGGGKAVVHPLKQPDMIGLLHLLEGPGHRGLGHVKGLRGVGDVAGAVDFHKDTDMAQVHGLSRLSFGDGLGRNRQILPENDNFMIPYPAPESKGKAGPGRGK